MKNADFMWIGMQSKGRWQKQTQNTHTHTYTYKIHLENRTTRYQKVFVCVFESTFVNGMCACDLIRAPHGIVKSIHSGHRGKKCSCTQQRRKNIRNLSKCDVLFNVIRVRFYFAYSGYFFFFFFWIRRLIKPHFICALVPHYFSTMHTLSLSNYSTVVLCAQILCLCRLIRSLNYRITFEM